jgi:flagellar hook protein FlgE
MVDADPGTAVGTGNNARLITFDATGALTSTATVTSDLVLASAVGANDFDIDINLSGTTQYGNNFSVASLVQDGYTTGRLSGIDIGETGVVQARYTNGQSRTLAQVVLANFSNPQGLQQLGETAWAETFDSGAALVGAAGTSSLGLVQSGALEGSNVDLTEQLVNMITAQRNFQANAQVISTADTITQTIINIR